VVFGVVKQVSGFKAGFRLKARHKRRLSRFCACLRPWDRRNSKCDRRSRDSLEHCLRIYENTAAMIHSSSVWHRHLGPRGDVHLSFDCSGGLEGVFVYLGPARLFSPVLFPAVAVGSIRLPRTQLHSQKRSALQGQTPPRGAHSRKASENVVFGVVKQVSGPGGPGGGSGLPCS
jgi:hypothetical protein